MKVDSDCFIHKAFEGVDDGRSLSIDYLDDEKM